MNQLHLDVIPLWPVCPINTRFMGDLSREYRQIENVAFSAMPKLVGSMLEASGENLIFFGSYLLPQPFRCNVFSNL